MTTPYEPVVRKPYAEDAPLEGAAPPPPQINPDEPPWGVLAGAGLWVASVALMALCQGAFLVPYVMRRGVGFENFGQFAASDPTAVFLQIVSLVPAHLLTLGAAWLIVTRGGRRPFFAWLGWGWGGGFTLWRSVALAVLLLLVGILILTLTGSPETPFDKVLASSRATAVAAAFLATFTAPLVEEIVYRGVLFSGLRKYLGPLFAGIFVVVLFALIHVPQYITSPGTIAVILLLSAALTLIRARTGRLLPCFVIHLIFNGIQSFFIVAEPYLRRFLPGTPPVPAPDPALAHWLAGFLCL